MKRKIIKIDEDKCNGCGKCIPNCYEGALQMIDNKARLVSDLFCDGLGNCIGYCPTGAITIEEREAEAYDEKKTMKENIVPKGKNTIKAHLEHLQSHGAEKYLMEALTYLKEEGIDNPLKKTKTLKNADLGKNIKCGCPGAKIMQFGHDADEEESKEKGKINSQLRQWPVQLHLVSPDAPYFQGKDVLLAADCTAYACGGFHNDFLKGRSLAIACPKLDLEQENYIEKIKSLIDDSKINTLIVLIMEVPCCSGLLHIAKKAAEQAKRKIPIKMIILGIKGNII
jgi:ferredoxin